VTVPHLTPAVKASSAPAAFAALRAQGLRLSTARRLLLQSLFDADRPLSADELAGEGDVASAYRNLEVLEGLGLVRHVHLGHGPGLYQPAGRPREFVVCEGCGAVAPLPLHARDAVSAAVLDAVGYRARFTHFPLAGLCAACSSNCNPDHSSQEATAC
jgi:Fur family transcriptional regulator, ferric uptake regulator